ncbi:GFA family protein [Sphingomonas lacusdianchii]|uniref:GFA family protein n=1 Tax=Sphingomonas lacusdianchii TaxID=2917992 RepID=UPI001F56CDC7|nr:GFA family protein [Sphingomonas sp. JXJ CY 53]
MPPALPIEGGCRCGQVRFRIDAQPMMTMACHRRGCQQMSGSAFSLNVAVPSTTLTITQGDTVIGGLRGEQIRHHHCGDCKSWLFTRIEPDPGFANVRVGALDDPAPFASFIETWTDEALAWATTPARHRYPQSPPPEAFGPLLAEFAARQSG